MQYWGFATLYRSSHHSSDFEQHLAALPEKVVVTDLFFLPEQAPRMFFDKICLEVVTDEQAEIMLKYLEKHHISEFILLLSANGNFRRMENKTLGKLLTLYPVIEAPTAINAAPGMPLFSARCRKARQ